MHTLVIKDTDIKGQGTPSQQILDPLGPEYTHRAKVHLTQQIIAHA